jgi:hypothetical protein
LRTFIVGNRNMEKLTRVSFIGQNYVNIYSRIPNRRFVFAIIFSEILVMYVLRFNLPSQDKYVTCMNPDCSVSFFWVYFPSITFFMFWQICYLFKTEVIDRKLFHESTDLTTSFRWLTKETDSTSYKLINYFGPSLRIPTFVGLQFMYHSLTLLPVKFMYEYKVCILRTYTHKFSCSLRW